MRYLALLIPLAAAAAGCSDDSDSPTGPSAARVSFFVTSQTSMTGNLGGLAGADATCQPGRRSGLVELCPRQSELREHGAARRRRTCLLFRAVG